MTATAVLGAGSAFFTAEAQRTGRINLIRLGNRAMFPRVWRSTVNRPVNDLASLKNLCVSAVKSSLLDQIGNLPLGHCC
jgi:hypothetical protein